MAPPAVPGSRQIRQGPAGASVIMVAAQDQGERERLVDVLPESYTVITVTSAHEGELVLATGGVAVAVVATALEDMQGLDWLGQVRRRHPSVMRLFAPAHSTESLAIASVNVAGVFRYVHEPLTPGVLPQAVADAIEVAGHRIGPPCMREAVARTIKAHSMCRGSQEGCLVAEQEGKAPLPETFLRRMSSRLGWTGVAILGLGVFLFIAFMAGLGVITLLYVFKSALGIDLIPDRHWTDWFHD